MIDTALFIPLVIVAITQMVKMAVPGIQSWVSILVAFVVGILVAVFDGPIGLPDITIAQGVMSALTAVGVTVLAAKSGGGARGDNTSS